MIWGMSQIPLVTLIITSLAVVNTVVSSVRPGGGTSESSAPWARPEAA